MSLIKSIALQSMIVAATSLAGAAEGGVSGGGGEHYAAQFTATALRVTDQLRHYPVPKVDAPTLAEAIARTRVRSVATPLFLNGQSVDAINYPAAVPPLIEFTQTAWDRLERDPVSREQLVIHEFLGIVGADDSHYAISSRVATSRSLIKIRRTGEVFLRVEDFPQLGESWQLPGKTIWGDLAQDANGETLLLGFEEADVYCRSLGARLPDYSEDAVDVIRALGGQNGNPYGYAAEALPHLSGQKFWIGGYADAARKLAGVFEGDSATTVIVPIEQRNPTRCVTEDQSTGSEPKEERTR